VRSWRDLLRGAPWLEGYPIPAYSEFMPPPRLGRKAYGAEDTRLFRDDDPSGWPISEYEEALELQPGLRKIGEQLVTLLARLGRGERARGIDGRKLDGNPCWPELLARQGAPKEERYVLLLPLALSRTQDDKGRVRWTLFGASDEGASRPLWQSEPGVEFFERLISAVYGEQRLNGFRVHRDADLPGAAASPLRTWDDRQSLTGVRYLVTFTPFAHLSSSVQQAYLRGDLHLLPFPGSLLFFHAPGYQQLEIELPGAGQIPLLYSVERDESPNGIRVPQSGWMREPGETAAHPGPDAAEAAAPHSGHRHSPTEHGPVRDTHKRTNRWTRVHRHEDELTVLTLEQKVSHALFSTAAKDLGLYGKPMARNSQIWTDDYRLVLDGPSAERAEIMEATRIVDAGGQFGYRFFYPPMQVGSHEVYWHRPLVAWASRDDEVRLLEDAPLGYLTARDGSFDSIELQPRLLARPQHRAVIEALQGHPKTLSNARKILDAYELLGDGPLDAGFARALLRTEKPESLVEWLRRKNLSDALGYCIRWGSSEFQVPSSESGAREGCGFQVPSSASGGTNPEPGTRNLEPAHAARVSPITFERTARRSFETSYWRTIARLAHGAYVNKDNADCVLDEATQSRLVHHRRDLERLGDSIVSYYERLIVRQPVRGAACGWLPFSWQTDFEFRWSGGWLNDQSGKSEERDLVLVIPGRDRSRAVIMADHYDTAYMENVFGRSGRGPRLAAPGADDNHSATAALMLAAPIFLELSRAGRLECDIWLVHLTGEEFPADCLGARHLCQSIVEGTLRLHRRGRPIDLSKTIIIGAFVLDMVAHNNHKARDIFQICPGWGRQSMLLARTAHEANADWNAALDLWNSRGARRAARRGRRSADPRVVPPLARHPRLHGEVRPPSDAHSTLYNTDGQIFSDVGIPVVLFMENYDINRHGYHDSHDTMENIDLDYGAALVAIAIETVARAAKGNTVSSRA
jgi:Peptidase family M28